MVKSNHVSLLFLSPRRRRSVRSSKKNIPAVLHTRCTRIYLLRSRPREK